MTRRLLQLFMVGGVALALVNSLPPDKPPDCPLGSGNHVADQVHAFSSFAVGRAASLCGVT